jgi:hypothetical protein
MHPAKRTLVFINVVGGIAVLGSYALGIATHPDTAGQVWGGVPEGLKPAYTASMLSAALGYFLFSGYVFFALDPDRAWIGTRPAYGILQGLYALILAPSALWMPLTFRMLAAPSPGLWLCIRFVLALVGIGSLGLLVALLVVVPRRARVAHALAIVGIVAFAIQTALLDAIVWPAYFPFP